MHTEIGRPSELTEELTLKIRSRVVEGKLYKDIQRELDISPNTWDTWVYKDYKDFRASLIDWKYEKYIEKAERNLNKIMDLPLEQVVQQGETQIIKTDSALVGQVAKVSMFVAERLNKKKYGPSTSLVDKEGNPIPILATFNVSINDGNQQNSRVIEENTDSAGRDISQQDHINTFIADSSSTERQDSDTDIGSIREPTSLETGSDQGLPVDNGGTQILQGRSLEQV